MPGKPPIPILTLPSSSTPSLCRSPPDLLWPVQPMWLDESGSRPPRNHAFRIPCHQWPASGPNLTELDGEGVSQCIEKEVADGVAEVLCFDTPSF